MVDERALVALLTDAEKEALRAFLSKSEIKEVARSIGRSPYTVEQRLKRARRKLGVRRSIDAAHMLARVEAAIYGSPVYATSDIAVEPDDASDVDPVEEVSGRLALPFPTMGRPWNDSSLGFRVMAILAGMLLATACALLTAALYEQVDRIVRQHL
jgi:DNA-binding CsgD family transcriptional regulator/predicted outer membrane lipoprotein